MIRYGVSFNLVLAWWRWRQGELLQIPKKEVVPIVHFAPLPTQRGGNWARDLASDSGNGGVNLRRGGGGGARLRLWGRRWDRLQSWRSLNELDINYVNSFTYSATYSAFFHIDFSIIRNSRPVNSAYFSCRVLFLSSCAALVFTKYRPFKISLILCSLSNIPHPSLSRKVSSLSTCG